MKYILQLVIFEEEQCNEINVAVSDKRENLTSLIEILEYELNIRYEEFLKLSETDYQKFLIELKALKSKSKVMNEFNLSEIIYNPKHCKFRIHKIKEI